MQVVGEEVVGRILENRKVQFLFQSEEAMDSILRRGPWSFNDWMCVLQKWSPNQTDEDLKQIPFWMQIRGIPLRFLTSRMITFIGNQLGSFVETDFEGDGAVLVDYVRVKLNWNIDKPLRFQRIFQFGGEAVVMKFRYERLRNFCTTCGLLTHDAAECPSTNNPGDNPNDDDDNDETPDIPDEDDNAESNVLPPGNHEAADTKEDDRQGATKKRKTEAEQSTATSYPLLCYDIRQAYATEDETGFSCTHLQVCSHPTLGEML